MSEQRDNRSVLTGTAPTQPVQKADDLDDVPSVTIPLPSGGKVYPVESSLHGRETIDIREMTTKQEDILTSQALAKQGTMVSTLIRSCMMDKSINPADLIVGDRYAILLAIRITGYGQHYSDTVECTECGTPTTRQFDMAKFPLKRLEIEPVRPGENLFSFTLPRSKKVVEFKFLTGHDEEDMHVTEIRQKKLGLPAGNENVTSSLIRSVVSVNGVTDGNKLSNFVRNMNAGDSLALRQFMGTAQPGMQFVQEQTCGACGHIEEVDMPLGLGFLWPHAKR